MTRAQFIAIENEARKAIFWANVTFITAGVALFCASAQIILALRAKGVL